MRLMGYAGLAFAALSLNAHFTPAFSCGADGKCTSRWIAAQDVGVDTAFVDRQGVKINAADVRIGDVLTANRNISVRNGAADFRSVADILRRHQKVTVENINVKPTSIGSDQVWLQISPVPDFVSGVICRWPMSETLN
jgi:hypothetical protein